MFHINSKFAIIFLIILFFVVSNYILSEYKASGFPEFPSLPSLPKLPLTPDIKNVEKFSSEDDFKSYLTESSLAYSGSFGLGMARGGAMIALEAPLVAPSPERISETNVQVAGIDEPDIVKTDGKEIYFSRGINYYWRPIPLLMKSEILPREMQGETKIIKAFPPEAISQDSKIEKSGDLLLSKNTLVVFSGNEILGYDVVNPKEPKEKWNLELQERNYLVGARLYKDKIYFITQTSIDSFRPCPIIPLKIGGTPLEIRCGDIYHPVAKVPIDVTYNATILNLEKGTIEDNISFVGSGSSSIVYMSKGGIYLTYGYQESAIKFLLNFLKEKGGSIFPSWVIEKIEKLSGYDISEQAKLTEFNIILEQFYNSLNNDERMRVQNELTNRMSDYQKEHKRELEKTGIVKIGLDKFEILATGSVSGTPLNQFSLDEYQDYLRVATTVGGGGGFWWWGGFGESANDVYVLDENLKEAGSVKDLGLTERIYSARFIEDKGYLVTFRQVDPFYVLDLSDPKNPQLKGELKIPGYSSYLHPVAEDRILGIGQESWKVKVSLLDVSSASNPKEADKYILDESWTDVANNHHAFLLDSKHEIFFLPGGRGGYIFSCKGDKLELKRAVSDIIARRAIYLDDYLYIIGDDKIVVLNELTWEKVKELKLK